MADALEQIAHIPGLAAALSRDGLLRCGPYALSGYAPTHEGLSFVGRGADGAERSVFVLPHPMDRPKLRERWRRETDVMTRFDHPSLARVHGAGFLDDVWAWYAEDLVRGDDLDALLLQGRLDREAGLEALALAARAIGHAHAQGVVSRGLTPQQIIVPDGQPPTVTRFGLQPHLYGDALGGCCGGAAPIGDPFHLAPELMAGRRTQAATADVWSLGVMLYRVLTGRRPFEGRNAYEIYKRVVGEPAVAPRALDPTVPRALDAACLRALEKDPQRRPRDANAFADELVAAMLAPTSPTSPTAPAQGRLRRALAWITG
jgi:eukaryotic-like serine/threonine-protein kinase